MQPASISRIATDGPAELRPALAEEGLAVLPLATAILIVEDSAMIAWTVESFLGQMGFTDIVMASTGEEAIALAQSAPPGLIVSDINLGAGADGVDTAIAITRDSHIPVLFVSAYADDAMRQRIANHLPLAGLICKPIQRGSFQAAVRNLLVPPAAR
jgi:CheY-like chemotaxis protein